MNGQKYSIFQGLRDTGRAIRNNAMSFLVATVLAYVLGIGVTYGVFTLLSKSEFFANFFLSIIGGSTTTILTVLLGISFLNLIVIAITNGYTLSVTSFGLGYDPAVNKASVPQLLFVGLRRFAKVALALLLTIVICFMPMIIATVLMTIYGLRSETVALIVESYGKALLGLSFLLSWIPLLRYILVPYIVLHERGTSVFRAFKRSKQLLIKGGQPFLIVVFIIGAAIAFGLDHIFRKAAGFGMIGEVNTGIWFDAALMPFAIFGYALLSTFYFKRRALVDVATQQPAFVAPAVQPAVQQPVVPQQVPQQTAPESPEPPTPPQPTA